MVALTKQSGGRGRRVKQKLLCKHRKIPLHFLKLIRYYLKVGKVLYHTLRLLTSVSKANNDNKNCSFYGTSNRFLQLAVSSSSCPVRT